MVQQRERLLRAEVPAQLARAARRLARGGGAAVGAVGAGRRELFEEGALFDLVVAVVI